MDDSIKTSTTPSARPQCPSCFSADYCRILALQSRSLYTCYACGLSTLWPRKEDRQLTDFYTEEYYNGTHKLRFDKRRIGVYERDFAFAMRGIRPGSLLDFGCGLGHFVAMAGNKGWESMGIDLSLRAVEIARRESGVAAIQGGVDTLAGMRERFDIISMWNVLDHLNDPLSAARVVHDHLTDSGRFVARILNLSPRIALFKTGCTLRSARLKMYFGLYHETMFTASTIRQTLRTQGFSHVCVYNSSMAGDVTGGSIPQPFLRGTDAVLRIISFLLLRRVCLAPSLLVIAQK